MNEFTIGLSVNCAFFVLGIVFKHIEKKYNNFFSKYSLIKFTTYSVTWLGMLGYFYFTKKNSWPNTVYLLFVALPSLIYFYLIYREIAQYARCGLLGATNHSLSEKDYDKSLKSCGYNLFFLGIGASKLTNSKEFLPAMKRCSDNKTIKFLLLNPKHKSLITASLKADKAKEKYEKIVTSSLAKISELKGNGIDNIEVRLYDTKPIFRLMFVDQSACTVSGYSLGDGDGSNLPQLYFKNSLQNSVSSTFYNSYEKYFNSIWECSTEWDFKEYL